MGTEMDLINIEAPEAERRDRFFARSVGTSFDVRAAAESTEIDLYDEVGFWGVNAKDFRLRLKDAGDVVLRINSPGGDVFDGLAMFNDLVAHKGKVRVEITGVAASIASIIAMAGDEIAMADNAFVMIHNAWTIGVGNRHDFNDLSGTLAKIDDALARTYASRTGAGIRSIKQMMDDETWLTAKEAKEIGFATGSLEQVEAKAKFDLSVFSSVPSSLVWPAEETTDEPPTKRDLERALTQDAGWSRSKARAALRAAETIDKPLQDAGEVDLTSLAEAVRAVSATIRKS